MVIVIHSEVVLYYFQKVCIPGWNQRATKLLNLVQQSTSTQQQTCVVTRQALDLVCCLATEQRITFEEMISRLTELGIEVRDGSEAYARAAERGWEEGDAHYAAINNAVILPLFPDKFSREFAQFFEQQYGTALDILLLPDLERALALEGSVSENAQPDVENVSEDTEEASNGSTEAKPEGNIEKSGDSAANAQFQLSQPGADLVSTSNSLLSWLLASLLYLGSLIKEDSDSSLNDLEQLQQSIAILPPISLFPIGFGSGSDEENSSEADPNDDPSTASVPRPDRNPNQPDHSGGPLAAESGEKQISPDGNIDSTIPVDQAFAPVSTGDSRTNLVEASDEGSNLARPDQTTSNNTDGSLDLESNQPIELPAENQVAPIFGTGNIGVETPGTKGPNDVPVPNPSTGDETPTEPVGPVAPGGGSNPGYPEQPEEPLPLPWPNNPHAPAQPPAPVSPTQPGNGPASKPISGGDDSDQPMQPLLPREDTDSEAPVEAPGETPGEAPNPNPISGGEVPDQPAEPPLPGEGIDPGEPDNDANQPDVIDAAGGRQVIEILPGSGQVVIANFGGVGKGTHPPQSIIDEVDTLQFSGAAFVAQNLLLSQVGDDLIIQFEGDAQTKVVLQNFQLENLDNFLRPDASVDLSNIVFNGQSAHQDSFDVFNADWQLSQVFNPGTTTFLNDLDNRVTGFDHANDVINAQAGNDVLLGLGGDDILRGGFGDDTLIGGAGQDTLVGNEGSDRFVISLDGAIQINDFSLGQDRIGLPASLSVDQLQIQQGAGIHSNDTWISAGGQVLAVLKGVQASHVTAEHFLCYPSVN